MASKLTALSDVPLGSAAVAKMSAEELEEALEHFYRQKAVAEAGDRRGAGRGTAAGVLPPGRRETSSEKWQVERFGQSVPSARAYDQVAKRAWDLPHLTRALGQGEISFDKMRALAVGGHPRDRPRARRSGPELHGARADAAGPIVAGDLPVPRLRLIVRPARCASTTPSAR